MVFQAPFYFFLALKKFYEELPNARVTKLVKTKEEVMGKPGECEKPRESQQSHMSGGLIHSSLLRFESPPCLSECSKLFKQCHNISRLEAEVFFLCASAFLYSANRQILIPIYRCLLLARKTQNSPAADSLFSSWLLPSLATSTTDIFTWFFCCKARLTEWSTNLQIVTSYGLVKKEP